MEIKSVAARRKGREQSPVNGNSANGAGAAFSKKAYSKGYKREAGNNADKIEQYRRPGRQKSRGRA